ncbi:hypothetical protein B0H19DRAFT_1241902 [Mycena capillaripes]|nr:hypothetical protein B0H19DRAFT_1241902 [Mycena capillaripes]
MALAPNSLTLSQDVYQYVSSISRRHLDWTEYMVWIRPSTTQLCVELMAPAHNYLALAPIESGIRPSDASFSPVPEDSYIMASLLLQAYQYICYFHLAQLHTFSISTNDSVQLGSIRHFTGLEYKNSLEIAFASDVMVDDGGWSTEDVIIENYWNRLQQMSVPKARIGKMRFWAFFDPRDRFRHISMDSGCIELKTS